MFHQSLRFFEGVFSGREHQGSTLLSIHAKMSVPNAHLYIVFFSVLSLDDFSFYRTFLLGTGLALQRRNIFFAPVF